MAASQSALNRNNAVKRDAAKFTQVYNVLAIKMTYSI